MQRISAPKLPGTPVSPRGPKGPREPNVPATLMALQMAKALRAKVPATNLQPVNGWE